MEKKHKINPYLIISFIYLIIFVPLVFMRYPDIRNELKYFVVVDEMISSKNYLILRYFSELYPDKPPLYFWILIFLRKFAGNLFYPLAILLGSLLPSFGILIILFRLLKKIKSKKFALIGVTMLVTTPFFMGVSCFLRMDMLMSFFIVMSLYSFFSMYLEERITNKNLIILYSGIILAVLTKGGAGALVPIVAMIFFLFTEKNLTFLKKLHLFKGIFAIVVVLVLWFTVIYFSTNGKDYISLMLKQETLGRITNSKSHSRPIYYYLKKLPIILFPYGIIFMGALIYYFKNIKNIFSLTLLEKIGLSWGIIPLIFFSFIDGKLDIYLIPLYPAFIILNLSFIHQNDKVKFKESLIKISKIILIFPIIFDWLFKKKTKLRHLSLVIIIIYFYFPVLIYYYNDFFTLEKISSILKYKEEDEIVAYKFSDFSNMTTVLNKEIKEISQENELQNLSPNKKTVIVSRNKYMDEVYKKRNFRLLYKNNSYSLFSNF